MDKYFFGFFKNISFYTILIFFIGCFRLAESHAQTLFNLDSDIIENHKLPEWILDAKILIQYVGAPSEMTHAQYSAFNVKEQRRRKIQMTSNLSISIDSCIMAYQSIGAKGIVSMVMAAYPGTEGLIITDDEVSSFREHGIKLGIHYNLLRRNMPVQVGDPTYINFWQNELKNEVERVNADFIFFDGSLRPMKEYQTPEMIEWYYKRALLNNREVWVNDDWRSETTEFSGNKVGDIKDMETETYDDVSEEPWINWDILTNEWNCWVNEFGMHKRLPEKWKWKYRNPKDQLVSFIDLVSKGGVWCVQLVNTKEAWDIMFEIGGWLKNNGEAIYNTRPLLPANPHAQIVPRHKTFFYYNGKTEDVWWFKWQKILEEAKSKGPFYFTQKEDKKQVFVIYTGTLSEKLEIELPVPLKIKSVELLDKEIKTLTYKTEGNVLLLEIPKEISWQMAYAFKIQCR